MNSTPAAIPLRYVPFDKHHSKMKIIISILFGLSIFLLSFQKQDNIGKAIFDNNCKSCHLPNKATEIAPSFQNIRKDYGLKWTLDFIKDSRKLRDKGDVNALYSYYIFKKVKHTSFPVLESKFVIKVLDYVDKFPVDTLQNKHRLVSYQEKKRFVQQQLLIDTVTESKSGIYLDTLIYETEDTLKHDIENKRKSTRRYNPKKIKD